MQSYIIVRKLNLFKFQREFVIMDGESHDVILTAVEKKTSIGQKLLRTLNVSGTSFDFDFFSNDGKKIFSIRKRFTWFASRTNVLDIDNKIVGILQRSLFDSFGGKYNLMTENDRLISKIKFESGTFNYKFITDANVVLAKVIRDSIEIREKRKEIVAKSKPLRSIYFLTTSIEPSTDLPTLWLVLSSVVGIDLAFMDPADESESYS